MNRKKFLVLISILFGVPFVPAARAQQLFISDANVGDGGSLGSGYCNSGVMGSSRSFEASGPPTYSESNVWKNSSRIEFERPQVNGLGVPVYPGGCLALCAQIVCVSTTGFFGINELKFEIFKYVAGANPLAPDGTPPIKTVPMYNIGTCKSANNVKHYINPEDDVTVNPDGSTGDKTHYYCTAWDGSYNLNGMFAKTNGQYGFRAIVATKEVSPTAGVVDLGNTASFPGQNQIPIQVDVMNIHMVRSSSTVVGRITPVTAQPHNIIYRLTKDATVAIRVYSAVDDGGGMPLTRILVSSVPRVGEGTMEGTLQAGDFWDGRDDHGNMAPTGVYRAEIIAESQDNWTGIDYAYPVTVTISHDPLQITDIAIKPLGATSLDQAAITYLLTESATVYVGIYPPDTVFTDINNFTNPPAASKAYLRLITEQKAGRSAVSTFWDGRDSAGNPVCDGQYVYAVWAELPSPAAGGGVIRNKRLAVGVLPVLRGLVVSTFTFQSSFMGSSPSAAGLDPFYFNYTPVRDALFTMNILSTGSVIPVRHLMNREPRAANNPSNRELWDGKDDAGNYVASGVYEVELIAEDPYSCAATRITTATIRIPVDMFRILDVKTTPLLGGASDMANISFLLSQTMAATLNVYEPNVVIVSSAAWPPDVRDPVNPALAAAPIFSRTSINPGRFNITEPWDGYNASSERVADGRYPFSLVAVTTGAVQRYASDRITGYLDVVRGQLYFTSFDVIPTVPALYYTSETVKLPPYEIDYMLTRQSSVTVQILDNPPAGLPRVVADVIVGEVRDGGQTHRDFWDGKCTSANPAVCAKGDFVPWASYTFRAVARDIGKNLTSVTTVQQAVEVHPLQIYDMAIAPKTAESDGVIFYQVSEPMKVATKIYLPGTSFATCLNNASLCNSTRLVKMFVGVRPARTQIMEPWNGTDLTLSNVPDGSYVFKVYASTNTDGISGLDGAVTGGAALISDSVTDNIPVVNGLSSDDAQLAKDIFFAPNPYTGTNGWFRIPIYTTSEFTIKIYNLAGDLIYKYSSGLLGGGVYRDISWPKTNSAGKPVSPGVYFAVIRMEGRDGSKGSFQTVKKILVP